MHLNRGRIWLGGMVAWVVWFVWSFLVGTLVIGNARYAVAQDAGLFLRQARYPLFAVQWVVILLVLSIIMAHLYAWTRGTLGPGPLTALKIGVLVGFAAGFPDNFGQAAWSPISRAFPLGWMLDMWGGCILASLVAGFLYKE
jgi:hypothetical protein